MASVTLPQQGAGPAPAPAAPVIWLVPLEQIGGADCDACERVLAPDEQARAARFRDANARREFVIGRTLLRGCLARYAGIPAADLDFDYTEYGKPVLSGGADGVPFFNVSHTRGLAVCAVSGHGAVGVDVEDTERAVDAQRLAPSVLAPSERRRLAQARNADEERALFLTLWTLKEAYVKARGLGVSLPLDGFAFNLGGATPRVSFSERCPDDPAAWRFSVATPSGRHRLALALTADTIAEVARPRLYWTLPRVSRCGDLRLTRLASETLG